MIAFPGSARQVPVFGPPDAEFRTAPKVPESGPAASLLHAVGTLDLPFAFFGRGGEVQYASPALLRLVAQDSHATLEPELRRFASALWGTANVRRLGNVIERLDEWTITLWCGECRIQGTFVGLDLLGGGPCVLVGVQLPHAEPYSMEHLRKRFGLTRKQSRVAQLLVEGLRNDEIARRLFISPHTARHHVEQVRLKVGGHTRTAVASRIRQVVTGAGA
jgi:DNA-binding CsgD family transcriptional regulator